MHSLHTRPVRYDVPLGPDLFAVTVAIDERDEVVLWGMLLGEEGLASVHGDRATPGRVVLLTPRARAADLLAWLTDVAPELPSLRIGPPLVAGPDLAEA